MLRIKQDAWIVSIVLTLFCVPRIGTAQLIRGFISGTATDSSNAVVPGVEITLNNVNTGISRNTVTDLSGFYRFAAVEPGDYYLLFKRLGFETKKSDIITIKTAQEVVLDPVLKIGEVSDQISVLATPGVELAKTTATVERTFSQDTIEALPKQIYNGA